MPPTLARTKLAGPKIFGAHNSSGYPVAGTTDVSVWLGQHLIPERYVKTKTHADKEVRASQRKPHNTAGAVGVYERQYPDYSGSELFRPRNQQAELPPSDSCVRNSKYGKVDFDEVVRECGIGSRASASRRYGRLQRAHGAQQKRPSVSQTSISTQAKPTSRKAIAEAAEAKRQQIEGGTNADPAADDDDIGAVWPKPEPDEEPQIKQEQPTPAQCSASYWSAPNLTLNSPVQPTSYFRLQSTSHNALSHEQLPPAAGQGLSQSAVYPYQPQYALPACIQHSTAYTPCISIERSISPETIIKPEVINNRDDAEDHLMTDSQYLTESSGVREHGLSQACTDEPFAPPMRSDQLCSASHDASLDLTMPTTSILQRLNHAADLNDQCSDPSLVGRAQEVIVIAD